MYQRIDLAAATAVGDPGPLPPELAGLDDATVADLSWVGEPLDGIYNGFGYWPVELSDPAFDPATEALSDVVNSRELDLARRVVVATRGKRPLTAGEQEAYRDELRAAALSQVYALREQHLAAGFDYDFGDARGIHRIGTTPSDMVGWDEVTKGAAAFVALGQGSTTFKILTETGPVIITALEWQAILVQVTAVRQPIWQRSFTLVAAIAAAADAGALAAIDIEGGWSA